jgi:hypothetical protein
MLIALMQFVNSNEKYQYRYQGGGARTPVLSHILMLCWFEPVLYLDPVSFQKTQKYRGTL